MCLTLNTGGTYNFIYQVSSELYNCLIVFSTLQQKFFFDIYWVIQKDKKSSLMLNILSQDWVVYLYNLSLTILFLDKNTE